jgi:hypothetical protein
MSIVLRPGTAADAAACGAVCYEAFKAIGTAHNFPPDFPSPQVASEILSMPLTHPGFYSVVAEAKGKSSAVISSTSDLALPASDRSPLIRQHRTAASGCA